LHHSGTLRGDVDSIDADHRQRRDAVGAPWLGIGYHFVIGNGEGMADGLIEPTFRWRQQIHGAHAGVRSYNERGIGICLIGDFTQTAPTARQIEATRRLLDDLSERYNISPERILKHSEIVATECPGAKFPFDEIVHRDVRDAIPLSPPAARRP
jgi:N-acetyl-anhydromuramyl-L-alanine amidase AmpD